MVQGALRKNPNKVAKSGGGSRKKLTRKTQMTKGRVHKNVNKSHKHQNEHYKADAATTREINQKNEVKVAAKAMLGGAAAQSFFLKDMAMEGVKLNKTNLSARNKKERKDASQTERLKRQLKKMGRKVAL
jgi:hypothetical protein